MDDINLRARQAFKKRDDFGVSTTLALTLFLGACGGGGGGGGGFLGSLFGVERRTVIIDNQAPFQPLLGDIARDGNVSSQERARGVEVVGFAEAGTTVRIVWGNAMKTVTSDSTSGRFSTTFTRSELQTGNSEIVVTNIDGAGHVSDPTRVQVSVSADTGGAADRTAPTLTGPLFLVGDGDIIVSNSEKQTGVGLRISAQGAREVEFKWGSTTKIANVDSNGVAEARFSGNEIPVGKDTPVTVRAIDAAGNVSAVFPDAIDVDQGSPITGTLSQGPSLQLNNLGMLLSGVSTRISTSNPLTSNLDRDDYIILESRDGRHADSVFQAFKNAIPPQILNLGEFFKLETVSDLLSINIFGNDGLPDPLLAYALSQINPDDDNNDGTAFNFSFGFGRGVAAEAAKSTKNVYSIGAGNDGERSIADTAEEANSLNTLARRDQLLVGVGTRDTGSGDRVAVHPQSNTDSRYIANSFGSDYDVQIGSTIYSGTSLVAPVILAQMYTLEVLLEHYYNINLNKQDLVRILESISSVEDGGLFQIIDYSNLVSGGSLIGQTSFFAMIGRTPPSQSGEPVLNFASFEDGGQGSGGNHQSFTFQEQGFAGQEAVGDDYVGVEMANFDNDNAVTDSQFSDIA